MAELKANTYVHDTVETTAPDGSKSRQAVPTGKWYGPDYPDNGTPPSGSVTNPAAFESQVYEDPDFDNRSTLADFAGDDKDLVGRQRKVSDAAAPAAPVVRNPLPVDVDKWDKPKLGVAIEVRGGTPPPQSASKEDFLEVLRGT